MLSERAVEKHTNSIFSKLGLSEERDLNRRVKAVLMYLHGQQDGWLTTPPRCLPPPWADDRGRRRLRAWT